jgi:hypothetical protein
VRFKEHIQAIKSNKDVSAFAQNILNAEHACGDLEKAVKILHTINKGSHMNTKDKFNIYEIMK